MFLDEPSTEGFATPARPGSAADSRCSGGAADGGGRRRWLRQGILMAACTGLLVALVLVAFLTVSPTLCAC
jgi:hypothetical protein